MSTSATDRDDGVIEYGSEVLRPEPVQSSVQGNDHIRLSSSPSNCRAGPSSNLKKGGTPSQPEASQSKLSVEDEGSSSKKTKKKKSKGKASTLIKKVKSTIGPSAATTSSHESLENSLGEEGRQLIIDRIRAQNGDSVANQVASFSPKELGRLMDQIHLMDLIEGKKGLGGRNPKDMADHKFWATQPVRRLDEDDENFEEGVIEPDKAQSEIRQSPLTLPDGYEWCTLDLADSVQLKELYELLTLNYVEDDDAMFRFDYTAPFIEWALRAPGFVQDWHVAVRVASGKRRLIAFISGVPMKLHVRSTQKGCVEINFLCIHKKLRSKRLAPVLIKEITRRCNIRGIFQAIYTAGVFLPTPISQCQYFHRNLNPAKLIATGFSPQPRGVSIARLKRMYECPASPQLPGFREMEERDLAAVGRLLRRYMSRFDLAPLMSDEEIRHNFISGRGRGTVINGRRECQVTWSFVVENPNTNLITDFISFYHLPSTAMKFTPHQTLDAAYLYYYATTSVPHCAKLGDEKTVDHEVQNEEEGCFYTEERNWSKETVEEREVLKKRLIGLVADILSIAQSAKFDVFNALTLMDNSLFLKELQFGAGDGCLNYYLYNWKVHQIRGGVPKEPGSVDENGRENGTGSGIGVVML
ncbi:Myristoyl-CoA:protein N-myristoyltransferase, N-terminal domain-containing protein [Phakopsora pachyrhizi]|nr:Myristoyl-CoA:protein N-myristoyltransferase, N-terminal domain-containing protein [Phakopsora pachyrhizi]